MCAQESHIKTFPSGTRISLESVRTFPSFSLVTRSTLRTERSRPSKSLSTERRTSNTTISQPSQTINSKSHSSGSSEDSLGKNINSSTFQTYLPFHFSDPNLGLTEVPLLQPTEVVIDDEQIQTMQKELEDVAGMELPEGEDEDF